MWQVIEPRFGAPFNLCNGSVESRSEGPTIFKTDPLWNPTPLSSIECSVFDPHTAVSNFPFVAVYGLAKHRNKHIPRLLNKNMNPFKPRTT